MFVMVFHSPPSRSGDSVSLAPARLTVGDLFSFLLCRLPDLRRQIVGPENWENLCATFFDLFEHVGTFSCSELFSDFYTARN